MTTMISAAVKEETAESWEKFEQLVSPTMAMAQGGFPWFVFRGQPQSFNSLQPSLTRLVRSWKRDSFQANAIEMSIRLDFKRLAHLHLDPTLVCPQDSKFEWSVLMQHHRAPTRLLDWSESPYVSLYFAVCADPGVDGELWAMPAGAVNAHFNSPAHITGEDPRLKDLFEPSPQEPPELIFLRPLRWSDRMAAQAAWVSACSRIEADHLEVIKSALAATERSPSTNALRLIIPKAKKPDFMKRLRFMNINARTLFPGVDGLGLAVGETALTYCQDVERAEAVFRDSGPEGGIYLGRQGREKEP